MLDVIQLKNTGLFQYIELEENQVLFNEGDIDNNLYFIESGEVTVEKNLTGETDNYKVLAIIRSHDIFGEGSLNNTDPKQVRIRASTYCKILKLDTQNQVPKLLEKYPKLGLELFKEIINTGNKRVLKSNALITSNFQMDQAINSLEYINIKSIIKLIDTFKDIINSQYIIYLENNPVMQNYLVFGYDTRDKGIMNDMIIEGNSTEVIIKNLKKNNVLLDGNIHTQKLNIADTDLGYVIIGFGDKLVSEDEKKIISSISNSLAGVLRQQVLINEQRDREFMKD